MRFVGRVVKLPWVLLVGGLLAGCSNDVRIGAVISESGSVATYGAQVKRGLNLALEEINAAGGYKGGTVELIYKDDATIPDVGERVVRELIEEDGVDMIIGAVSSPVTLRIAPICEEKEVVLLSPSSSAEAITRAGDWIFRNYPSDILEGTSIAKFAKDEGFERVAIFALDNEWGSGLTSVFTQEYESRFREVVKVFRIPENQFDGFSALIEETKALKPDGIYIVSYDQALGGLLKELTEAQVNTVVMGTSSVPQNIARTVGAAAEKLIFPRSGFDSKSREPAVANFVQAYRQKYGGEDPDIFAAHGYDALKLFLEAIRAADSLNPHNVKLGMTTIKGYEGAAGQTTFDKFGDVVRYPRLFVIHEGSPVPYDQFKDEGLSLVRNSG